MRSRVVEWAHDNQHLTKQVRHSITFYSTELFTRYEEDIRGLVREQIGDTKEIAPALPPKDCWKIW